MRIFSSIDKFGTDAIEGWITDLDASEAKFELEFRLDDSVLGYVAADQFRKDLADAALSGGFCAFRFEVPPFLPKGDVERIGIRVRNSALFLRAEKPKFAESADRRALETVSRFGGLWIDRRDWVDVLGAKHRSGELSEEQTLDIFRFVRDGYIVFPGAASEEVVDELNRDIDRVWTDPPPGLTIETFEPDGQLHYIPPDMRFRAGRTKLLDLYAYSGAARAAVASPAIVSFLGAIFEDTPKAFQGLTFWMGSQQAIHKDTAYVKVDSNPMHLAATWLALEDIEPGTGELEYFVGSHRAPDFLFGGKHKWMESHGSEHDQFLASLKSDAETYGHKKSSFLAKKGDILVWHADLAHGGSPITRLTKTRRSLVTHFTRGADEPFYRRHTQYEEAEWAGCRFVSQYANIVA